MDSFLLCCFEGKDREMCWEFHIFLGIFLNGWCASAKQKNVNLFCACHVFFVFLHSKLSILRIYDEENNFFAG